MDKNDKKIDDDILRGMEDIRRARKDAPGTAKNRQNTSPATGPSPLLEAVVDANKQRRTQADSSDVPAFNVADRILTRQRHASAAKRTAPAKSAPTKTLLPVPPASRTDRIEHKTPAYHRIIAQIVARDIDTLCRGRSLAQ